MRVGYLEYFPEGTKVKAYNDGVETHGVNPKSIETMLENVLDILKHTSNIIEDDHGIEFDFVINVCDNAKEHCPYFPTVAKKFHHNFPDPAKSIGTSEEIKSEFGIVRKLIKDYWKAFVGVNLLF